MSNKHNKHNKYPLIKESLSEGDLKWLVNEVVYIDMHKTKLGDDKDYIVVSIAVNDNQPAHDLATFIENSVYEIEDVEVSQATDPQGRYLVYIEIKRDNVAYESIKGMLSDASKLSGIENWKFKGMGMATSLDLDQDSFSANIITSPEEYEAAHPAKVEDGEQQATTESIKKRLDFLLKY